MKYFIKIVFVLSIVLVSNNISGQSPGWTVNPVAFEFNGTITAVVFHGTNEVTTGTLGAFVGGTCRGVKDGSFFPPTGKTVFTVMCYSNAASGETLTFKYYNPSNGIIYDIKETVGFVADMREGTATLPLQFHTLPLSFAVTGGGSYCAGGSGLPVGLDGSETGVIYTLLKNGTPQTPTIAGTGTPITFGDQLVGTYTVSGSRSGTSSNMTGNATITENSSGIASVSISALPAGAICPGTSVTFTAIPSNGGTPSYQWKKGGIVIPGATEPSYTTTTLVNGDAIKVEMTSTLTCATGSPATSNTVIMIVNPFVPASVNISAVPSGAICPGTSVIFTANAINGGITPAYQWKLNNVNVGSNSATYTNAALANGDQVKCVLTSNAACATGSPATSNTVTMTVNPNLPVSVTISASSTTICAGTTVTFTAAPVNGGAPPAYQWKLNNVNVGSNSATYTNAALANGDQVKCVLTSNATCATGSPATSNTLTMTVNPTVVASVSISASSNPVCAGTSVLFTATPTNGGTPTYQWFKNEVAVATGVTYNYVPVNGDAVYVVMTSNAVCATASPATSNTVTMTVNPNLPVSVSISASSTTICAGTTVTFTAAPVNEGAPPAYQWKLNNVNVGSNSVTYNNATLANGDQVKCVLTSNATCATSSPATSNTLTMTVNPILTASVVIGSSSNPACTGTTVTFNATATNGGSPSYQWKVNETNVGSNSPVYSYNPLNGDIVKCIMTSNLACVTGSPATSNSITMTVNSNLPASVAISASANPVCSGASVIFTAIPTNGGSSPSYQWKLNGGNVGINSPTYTNSSLANGNTVLCVMTSNASCATGSPATSNTVTMTVNPIVTASVSIAASSNPVCAGTSVSFTATPTNGGSSPSYQWKLNGNNVGANNTIYTTSSLSTGDLVTCVLTSNATCVTGNPATSNTIAMTVNPILNASVIIAAVSNPVCTGTSATFIAAATNGGAPPVYQWKVNGVNSGTNNLSYTYTPVDGDIVTCVLTSNATCVTGSPATSNAITMSVNSNLAVNVSISASSNPSCSGSSVTFTATPTNGGSVPAYKWYKNSTLIAGANNSSYSYIPSSGDKIKVTLTSNLTCATGNPATSNEITMAINPNLPASVSITSSANPICSGTSVNFTATPINGGTTPVYQWKLNGNNVGLNNATYTNATLTNGDLVSCVLTSNATCPTGNPATSNIITMAVNPNLPVSVSIAASANPVCSGSSVTFTATPANGGSSPSYQWKLNSVNVGTNSSTYSNTAFSNGDLVACVLTSNATCATGSPATSNLVTMTINPYLPVSVSVAASSTTICSGTLVTFTASPVNGGTNPSYQWKLNSSNVGTNSATYTSASLANGNKVTCILTSNATCPSGNPATSNEVIMTVNSNLAVSVSITASANPICAGTSVTFTATPTNGGTTPVYQWKLNGTNVGTNSTTYTNASLVNNDKVTCALTSSATCPTGNPALSNEITMTVNPNLPASVSIAASSNPACTGSSVTFTATPANGGSTPVYQWKVNGANVGTNSATYSYVPVNNDAITCIMTSNSTCATGSPATSNMITMTISTNLPVSVSVAASSNPVCAGMAVAFTAVPTNGGTAPVYQWYKNTVAVGTNSSSYSYIPITGDKVYVVLTSNLSCASGNPSTSNTVTMTVNPNLPVSVSIAASSNTICAGTSVTFTATTTNGGTIPAYQWKLNGTNVGTNSTIYTNASLTNGDKVTCVLTSNAICPAGNPATSNMVTMTVDPNLPVSVLIAASSNPICEGSSVIFNATPTNGGTIPVYQWKVNGVNSGANNPVYSYTPKDGEIVTCTLTSNAACATGNPATSDPIALTVNVTPTAPVVGTITQPTCEIATGSVELNGLPVGTWTLKPGNITGATTNKIITGLVSGTYTYTVTNSFGCSSVVSENVIVKVQPAIPSAPVIGTITQPTCAVSTGSVALVSLPAGSWTLTRSPGNVLTSGTGTSTIVSGLPEGTCYFSVTNSSGCTSLASGNVVIIKIITPTVNISNPAPVCSSSTVDLTTTTLTEGSTAGLSYSYWINSGASQPYSTPTTAGAGTYYIKGTTSSGCYDIKPVTVTVLQMPVADAGPDQILEHKFVTTMNAAPVLNNESGIWSLISGKGDILEVSKPKSSITGLSLENNKFLWTVTNGVCPASSDTVTIIVRDLIIPTLITPNMDGKNDYFVLRGIEALGKTELVIFNRRGAQVYKNSNYDNKWSGIDYNENPLPDDTYFFVIKSEEGKAFSGYIVVRR